jgi:modification methylase
MPNFRGKRLTNAHETLIWASKEEASKYTFNYEALKALNEGVQMRSDWVLPSAPGTSGSRARTGPRPIPRRSPSRSCTGSSWRPPTRRRGARPLLRDGHDRRGGQAPGPRLHRHRARGLLPQGAEARIAQVRRLDNASLETATSKKAEPRVAFGVLVERGMLRPGEELWSLGGRHKAKVRADGTLVGRT